MKTMSPVYHKFSENGKNLENSDNVDFSDNAQTHDTNDGSDVNRKKCPINIFTKCPKMNGFLEDTPKIEFFDQMSNYEKLWIPVDVDSEYVSKKPLKDGLPRKIVTVQLRADGDDTGSIYTHPQCVNIARHKVFKDFAIVEYFKDMGVECEVSIEKKAYLLPKIEFCLFGFMALVDVLPLFTGKCLKTIEKLFVDKTFVMDRRLKVQKTIKENEYIDFVSTKIVLKIENKYFQVCLSIFDMVAAHGNTNYLQWCTSNGIMLKYKEDISQQEKENMDKLYTEKPEIFDNYSLGDLQNLPAYRNYSANVLTLYKNLDIEKYFQPPKLTVGATVAHLLNSLIGNLFDTEPTDIKDLLDKVCKPGNAIHLKQQIQSTKCLNAKVKGGRCRNNRPLDTVSNQLLCDLDISGCYGEGQRNQIYPFGNPLFLDYPWKEPHKRLSLGKFLKKYGGELVPGCWIAIGSTLPGYKLKNRQDFLASWILPKKMSDMETDTDLQNWDNTWENWLKQSVNVARMINYEIHHGTLNHDFIEWLDNICTPQQRRELLDNLYIETAMIYPKSERVNTPEELLAAIENFKGLNDCKLVIKTGKSKAIHTHKQCHSWFGINLGDLVVTRLLIERKKHAKKTPLNNLYKLFINTMFGDMASQYFGESNVVAANNVTARARALAWYMEKGLNGWQSITDGCVFDLNNVIFPGKKRLTGVNTVNNYKVKNRDVVSKPLGGEKISVVRWEDVSVDGKVVKFPVLKVGETIIPASESYKWIDKTTWIHLQNCFPNVSVLHAKSTDVYGNKREGQFNFETKAVYETGGFHGTANYCLKNPNGEVLKMRSYIDKPHKRVNDDGEIVDVVQPSKTFLNQLIENPKSVERCQPCLKSSILKPKEYIKRLNSYFEDKNLYPGDTIYKTVVILEFSLAQFTFETMAQYKSWEREKIRLLKKHGQSYEMFFINDDGTLDYQSMIENIDRAIGEGYTTFQKYIDKNRHKNRLELSHPYRQSKFDLQEKLDRTYEKSEENVETSDDDWENFDCEGDGDYQGNGDYDPDTEFVESTIYDGDDNFLDDVVW